MSESTVLCPLKAIRICYRPFTRYVASTNALPDLGAFQARVSIRITATALSHKSPPPVLSDRHHPTILRCSRGAGMPVPIALGLERTATWQQHVRTPL